MTNANIKTVWQSSKFLFMGFLIFDLNLKDLKASVKYKKKAINNIINIYIIRNFY